MHTANNIEVKRLKMSGELCADAAGLLRPVGDARGGRVWRIFQNSFGLKRAFRVSGAACQSEGRGSDAGRWGRDRAWCFVALHPVALLAVGLGSACSAEPFNAGIDETVATEAGLYEVHFVVPGPVTAGRQTASAEVWHEGEPLSAELALDAFMPAHVHGMGPDPIIAEVETGVYDVSWTWPMAGAWQVMLTVDGVEGEDAAVFDVGVE